jgi:acetyltransferase-like isoleucine patch superfamily enzyme
MIITQWFWRFFIILNTINKRFFGKLLRLFQLPRIFKYRLLSNCKVVGRPYTLQPVQLVGRGEIHFKGRVNIGFFPSPYFLNGYAYIEARKHSAKVIIDNDTWINNNFVAVSEHKSITIGKNVFIGTFVEIYDSNFHGLESDRRSISSPQEASDVVIEDNVFIGSNVKILKGVTIGQDSVIANGSIVTKNIPSGVIAGGNPAKVIRQL